MNLSGTDEVTARPRVLVTGGAAGIGAACVDLFLAQGAAVASLDRRRRTGLRDDVISVQADVRDAAAVDVAVTRAAQALNGLDVLVNCAGVGAAGGIADNRDEEWAEVLDVNVTGMVRVTRAALPHLRRSTAAAIVNVSSVVALTGFPDRVLYSASKAAGLGLTRALARDLVAEGVRVNAVAPGHVDTDWITRSVSQAADPAAARRAMDGRHPIGRMATPREVAEAVVHLSGSGAGFTTGTVLVLDGGLTSMVMQ